MEDAISTFRQRPRQVPPTSPFVVGELNYDVNQTGDDAEKRAMMVLASAAYGAFQGWSGLVWFAWNHGETTVRPTAETRSRNLADRLSSAAP